MLPRVLNMLKVFDCPDLPRSLDSPKTWILEYVRTCHVCTFVIITVSGDPEFGETNHVNRGPVHEPPPHHRELHFLVHSMYTDGGFRYIHIVVQIPLNS